MDDEWKQVTAALNRFGLPARQADRTDIIAALHEQIRLAKAGAEDQDLMRLLCAQLFSLGVVEDSLLVWEAKSANFDCHMAISVRFLCGAGYDQTKHFLNLRDDEAARDALKYISGCDPDFADFSVEHVVRNAQAYFQGP
jgi:hypothetical protein